MRLRLLSLPITDASPHDLGEAQQIVVIFRLRFGDCGASPGYVYGRLR